MCLVIQSCPTLCDPMGCSHQTPLSMGFFPGKNTGVGGHFLLQGFFLTQESNPHPSPAAPALVGRFFTTVQPWKPLSQTYSVLKWEDITTKML